MATLGNLTGIPPAPAGEFWASGWVEFNALDSAASGYANGTFRVSYPIRGVVNVSGTAFVTAGGSAVQLPMKTSSGDDAPSLVMTGTLVSNQGTVRSVYGYGAILASSISPTVQWNINTAMLGGGGWSGPGVLYAQDVGVSVRGLTGVRKTVTFTTAVLADGASANVDVAGVGRIVRVLRTTVDCAARVRGYATSAIRTLDASRPASQDAAPEAPCPLEVTTSATVLDVIAGNPATIVNFDSPTQPNFYATVTNLSGSARAVSVTLVYVIEEA